MSFACGGLDALAILETRPCDVVVCDYRMPGMDGAAVLQWVRDWYPGTARVILSGHTDESDLLTAARLSHQFLHKPCREEDLVQTIEEVIPRPRATCAAVVPNREAQRITVGPGTPPTAPHSLRDLLRALTAARRPLDVQDTQTVGIVSDPATPANNVRAALLVRDLVAMFAVDTSTPAGWADRFTRDALETARLSRHLAGAARWADAAFTAGLLREVGQLVLASYQPEVYPGRQAEWSASNKPLSLIEIAAFGTDHAVVGAALLDLWKLPHSIVRAVAGHATVQEEITDLTDPTSTVALAHALTEAHLGPHCGRGDHHEALNEQRLPTFLRHRIDTWRSGNPEPVALAAKI